MIKEGFQLTASNTDILAAPSRLAAIPYEGTLIVEVSCTDADGTNYGDLTVQLPDGSIPLENVPIPFSGNTGDGMLDNDTELMLEIPVRAGGHVLIDYTENGTVALCFMLVTLLP